uniref:Uncharacterized protein n=1 Tax=Arundo donax TaxID=35708 RepID=A0A0A8ZVJ4_ARUDO
MLRDLVMTSAYVTHLEEEHWQPLCLMMHGPVVPSASFLMPMTSGN